MIKKAAVSLTLLALFAGSALSAPVFAAPPGAPANSTAADETHQDPLDLIKASPYATDLAEYVAQIEALRVQTGSLHESLQSQHQVNKALRESIWGTGRVELEALKAEAEALKKEWEAEGKPLLEQARALLGDAKAAREAGNKELLVQLKAEMETIRGQASALKPDLQAQRATIKERAAALNGAWQGHEAEREEIKALREQVKALREQIVALREAKRAAWASFGQGLQAGDLAGMEAALQQVIGQKTAINGRLGQVLTTLQQVESVLRSIAE